MGLYSLTLPTYGKGQTYGKKISTHSMALILTLSLLKVSALGSSQEENTHNTPSASALTLLIGTLTTCYFITSGQPVITNAVSSLEQNLKTHVATHDDQNDVCEPGVDTCVGLKKGASIDYKRADCH